MKVLVISDTHGNLGAIKHLVGFAKAEKMGAILHCGDFTTPQDVVEVLRANIPFYAVMGNADEARYEEIWSALSGSKNLASGENLVTRLARNSAIHCAPDVWEGELSGRKIAIAHQPEKIREHINSGNFDAVFHGHLHMSAGVKKIDDTLVVNPGALGNTISPSFAVYDTDLNAATIIELPA